MAADKLTLSGGELHAPTPAESARAFTRDKALGPFSAATEARWDTLDALAKLYHELGEILRPDPQATRDRLLEAVPALKDLVLCPACGREVRDNG